MVSFKKSIQVYISSYKKWHLVAFLFQMKKDFKFIEYEMNSLSANMEEIRSLSGTIDAATHANRERIRKLSATHQNLQRLRYLSQLPSTIRGHVERAEWDRAVAAYSRARPLLERFHGQPSFQGIHAECAQLTQDLARKVDSQLCQQASSIVFFFYSN